MDPAAIDATSSRRTENVNNEGKNVPNTRENPESSTSTNTKIPLEEEVKKKKPGWLLEYLNEQEKLAKNNDSGSDDSDTEISEDNKDKKPAWEDYDDNVTFEQAVARQSRKSCNMGINAAKDYNKIMEEKYKSVMGVPKWAKKKSSEVDLLSSTGELVKRPKFLAKGKLEWVKLKDLNNQTHQEGPYIKDVKFHPRSTVALVAGVSGIASLFAVDGSENAKLQSIEFKRYPISCTAFLRDGDEILVGSPHYKYFYSHDLISGRSERVNNATLCEITNTKRFCVSSDGRLIAIVGTFGNIYLMSSTSKEFIGSLRMNGRVHALNFFGNKMYSHGEDGEVYVWDMDTRQCIHKFVDDGCLTGTALAVSPDGDFLATGSSSGIVNIYDLKKVNAGQQVSPVKTIYNLVTSIDALKFNATSEILCAATDGKENAVKLIHCGSMTIFDNFPSFQLKCHRVQCVDFSPNSGYFAFGNNKKSAMLFRLNYYGNY